MPKPQSEMDGKFKKPAPRYTAQAVTKDPETGKWVTAEEKKKKETSTQRK